MSENQYVSVTVQEYGYPVTMTPILLHMSFDYVCPNPDTCSYCNRPPYVPPVLTHKQKVQKWWRSKKYKTGRFLSAKANKLGYYEECDCDY